VKKHTPRPTWISPSSSQALANARQEPGLAERALELAGKAPESYLHWMAKDFYDFARTALPALAERVLALEKVTRENVGDAHSLMVQGEWPLARRPSPSKRIYERSKAALAAEESA
jgi:hypothetical protein